MAWSEQTAAERRRLPAGRRQQRGGAKRVGIRGWKEASEAIFKLTLVSEVPSGRVVNGRCDTMNCSL